MLSNKNIVVVGGAGLIGSEVVNAILSNGGNVYLADLESCDVQDRVQLLMNKFGQDKITFIPIDITSEYSIECAFEKILKKCEGVSGVVNCSYPRSKNYGKELFQVQYDDFCDTVSAHLGGYFLLMKVIAKFMTGLGSVSVVNFSSIYGVIAPRFEIYEGEQFTMPVEYAASKSGILHITRYFSKYYQNSGLRFNCICPGGVYDGHSESFVKKYGNYNGGGGMLNPSDVVGPLIFLISDMSLAITGQALIVDHGWTL